MYIIVKVGRFSTVVLGPLYLFIFVLFCVCWTKLVPLIFADFKIGSFTLFSLTISTLTIVFRADISLSVPCCHSVEVLFVLEVGHRQRLSALFGSIQHAIQVLNEADYRYLGHWFISAFRNALCTCLHGLDNTIRLDGYYSQHQQQGRELSLRHTFP